MNKQLEQYVKKTASPDASWIEVGGDGHLSHRLKKLLKSKGLELRKKTGRPSSQLVPAAELRAVADKSCDFVVLNGVLNSSGERFEVLLESAIRIAKERVIIQDVICATGDASEKDLEVWAYILGGYGACSHTPFGDSVLSVLDVTDTPARVPTIAERWEKNKPPPEGPSLQSEPPAGSSVEELKLMQRVFADNPEALAVINEQLAARLEEASVFVSGEVAETASAGKGEPIEDVNPLDQQLRTSAADVRKSFSDGDWETIDAARMGPAPESEATEPVPMTEPEGTEEIDQEDASATEVTPTLVNENELESVFVEADYQKAEQVALERAMSPNWVIGFWLEENNEQKATLTRHTSGEEEAEVVLVEELPPEFAKEHCKRLRLSGYYGPAPDSLVESRNTPDVLKKFIESFVDRNRWKKRA